jgi:hypothetical protein
MNKETPLKEIVTVSEMSRMCRLSRARFYQLINEGIFPSPSRNEKTKRPYFNREQQEQCLEIRRSNRGANGKAVMFYGCRLQAAPKLRSNRKQLPISKSSKTQNRQDPVISELRHGLAQLGLTNLTEQTVREALARTYPDDHQEIESAELLRTVFGAIQCRDSADKLSG